MPAFDYGARRAALANRIGPNATLLIGSGAEKTRNSDSHYAYRQHSDVLYLTGFAEPGCTVLFRPGAEHELVLFVRPRDPETEQWDGRRAGIEGAMREFGAAAAYPSHELSQRLPDLLANREVLHFSLGSVPELDAAVIAALTTLRRLEKKGKRPPDTLVDLRQSLHDMRLRKDPAEIARLQSAADITAAAHRDLMQRGRPGRRESELEADLQRAFRLGGGHGPGYTPIVGAGANATILHYVEISGVIAPGDLVLVDAGCEVDGYTADVTRTFPADGVFSSAQRDVYALVLATQLAAIQAATVGSSIDAIHALTQRSLTQGMIDLGLLTGTVDARIEDRSYMRYYMHGTSHWLGLDVHDAGAYLPNGQPRPLEPGMVLTVEPGLYIRPDDTQAPAALRGIGVRIEDDVLVCAEGPRVLSAACPKSIADVEAACR